MNANINQQHMFSNKMIRALLVPIILEQLLNSIMGTADTMMLVMWDPRQSQQYRLWIPLTYW